jgi:transcriptional regulator with PAS, ATPase and Fis domain
MKTLLEEVRKVGPTPTTVLLTGETGTGKERIARAVHLGSARRDEPFVSVNCAAIPAELAEGGTLFLDEVAELSPESQAKLLRVLEDRQVTRVGATAAESVDVRVIAATHAYLEARVEDGRFRKDLFFRLAVFRLDLPPLRARHRCIPALAEYLLAERARRHSQSSLYTKCKAYDLDLRPYRKR